METARQTLRAGRKPLGYSPDALPEYAPVVQDAVDFEPDEEQPTPELAALQRRITALEDVWAIENLMSRHEYLHAAGLNEEELDTCFALSQADLSFEPEDWGVWEGAEAIRLCYVDGAPPVGLGMMTEHDTSTALVVVADAGRTAKGVWMWPGHETFASPDGDSHVFWSWGRYGVDFVKENGRWKFWHFYIYTTFRTPFGTSWVDSALGPRMFDLAEGETPPGMTPPTLGVTDNAPYHPSRAPRLLPDPPRRYPDVLRDGLLHPAAGVVTAPEDSRSSGCPCHVREAARKGLASRRACRRRGRADPSVMPHGRPAPSAAVSLSKSPCP
ncbi:nuclear transport factor 2 family protein [Streptomyces sp. NPDC096132]|uniref:nuclear transport factor 2 family protein n=1 Tax=Streptomyces sp. NPDC096132 TaxID=3366075 RepID=UPI0037F47C60